MIFRKSKKTVKESLWGMDKLISWIIIGGAAASIFGLSRTKKWKKITEKGFSFVSRLGKKTIRTFGFITVSFLDFFQKK